MISELTAEQRAALPAHIDRWVAFGLQTENAETWWSDDNQAHLERIFAAVYAVAGRPAPRVLRVASPRRAMAVATATASQVLSFESRQAAEQWAAGLDIVTKPNMFDCGYGQHDAELSAYEFYRNQLGLVEQTEKILPLLETVKHCGWWIPCEHLVVVSARPTALRRDPRGRLHAEGQPAVEFAEGFQVWAYRGVRFGRDQRFWLRDPVADLPLPQLLSIPNIDQRAAVLARVGADRLATYLPTTVVATGSQITKTGRHDYSVLDIQCGPDLGTRRYLKMQNPSEADKQHLEGLPPDCATVEAALFFRTYGRLPSVGETYTPPNTLT